MNNNIQLYLNLPNYYTILVCKFVFIICKFNIIILANGAHI